MYLLHFNRRYKHAGHYIGYTENLEQRLEQHRTGSGRHAGKLVQAARAAGISFVLARTWEGDRTVERRKKRQGGARRLCPICRGASS